MKKIIALLKSNYFSISCIIGLGLISIFFSMKENFDSDLFWHLATARWMVENGAFPREDYFSFVYRGAPWVDIPWIFQLVAYFFNQTLGYFGILLITGLVCALSAIFSWQTYQELNKYFFNRDKVSNQFLQTLAFSLFSLGFFFLEKRWIVRPEIFTALFMSLEIYILVKFCIDPLKQRLLWLLPLIQILWVNSHGMFILGYILMGTVWLSRPKKMTLPLLASVVGAFINPYGWQGAFYPFYLRKLSEDDVYRVIGEGRTLLNYDVPLSYKVFWGVWLVFLFFSIRPGMKIFGKAYLLLLAFAVYFSTTMVRNLSPAVLITLPFIVAGIISVFIPLFKKVKTSASYAGICSFFILGYTALFCGLIYLNQLTLLRTDFYFGTQLPDYQAPREAAEFLVTNHLDHRVLGTAEFENYMMWYQPGFETYIDTRYAEVVPKEHFSAVRQHFFNPSEIESEAAKYQIDTLAINHNQTIYHQAIHYLINSPHWHLAHFDSIMVIFVKNGIRDDLTISGEQVDKFLQQQADQFISEKEITHGEIVTTYQNMLAGVVLDRGELVPQLLWKISEKTDYQPVLDLLCASSTLRLSSGKVPFAKFTESADRAEDACRKSYKTNQDPAIAFNIGTVLLLTHRPLMAYDYFAQAAKERPNNAENYSGMADALSATGDFKLHFDEIEKDYLQALSLNPYTTNAWIFLGRAYESVGKLGSALNAYEHAAQLDHSNNTLNKRIADLRATSEELGKTSN